MAQLETTQGLGTDVTRLPPALTGHAGSSAASQPWGGLLPWQARRVRDYVDGGLEGRPSIKGAAERVRLSPSYFSRRFRQSFGVTFSRYVGQRRIALAQRMMIRSPFSLCQIALACGFSDQAHFTRTFGGVIGSTPSQWRKTVVRSGGRVNAIGSCLGSMS